MRAPLRLPAGWPTRIRRALVSVVSLAHFAVLAARGRASTWRGALERARCEIALLEEELRIKDAQIAKIAPRRRPHHDPADRLAILKLRAARGWSLRQTASRMHARPATIASWMRRIEDPELLATPPINRFPDFVAHAVQRLKTLVPTMGTKRIADTLARAGLHVGRSTVRRILRRAKCEGPPDAPGSKSRAASQGRLKAGGPALPLRDPENPVRATRTHHVWQVDLTIVPLAGMWTSWIPFALPQRWPFAWWVACVIDQYSRRIVAADIFRDQPTAADVRATLERAALAAAAPKYLVSDRGGQLTSYEIESWCSTHGVTHRFATKGSLRATAVIERFFRSMKSEWTRRILVALQPQVFRRQLRAYIDWHHAHRPHQGLGGRTPDEVFHGRNPANEAPRYEPRKRWPANAPCAGPYARRRLRSASAELELEVRFLDREKNLPVVELRPVR